MLVLLLIGVCSSQTMAECHNANFQVQLRLKVNMLLFAANTHINQRQEAVVFSIFSQNLSNRLVSKLDRRRRRRRKSREDSHTDVCTYQHFHYENLNNLIT